MTIPVRFAGIALALLAAVSLAQPPGKEEEDPKSPPRRPVPKVEDELPADGPGIPPPPNVLVVAVRSLPEFMSPTLARSDSERFALDLLFEGLVRPTADLSAGRQFEAGLARELPALAPRGREFQLAAATWANGSRPVNSADVRSSVEKLRARAGRFGGDRGEFIEAVFADADDRGRVVLSRGVPDPLSLLTFKILPNDAADDEAFAKQPIGSGPFVYTGRRTDGGRSYAIFTVNPAYGKRTTRPNLPRLQAVWMVASRNPVADFRAGRVHLALTPATADLASLRTAAPPTESQRGAARLEVTMGTGRVDTLASRRIHMLAVNHRDRWLGASRDSTDLRRLIAHAIQRDAVLTSCFRAGFADHHQPLDGPFPPGTWPCNPVAGRLDDSDLARKIGGERKGDPITLELKYPSDDPAVERARQQMQQQFEDLKLGVKLKLAPRSSADLRRQVTVETDFQLAYWQHDFADDWFDLAAILDPQRMARPGTPDTRNFMSYEPGAEMASLLARSQKLREFSELRKTMRQVHVEFRKEMPFIPLWHLDTHVLASSRLKTEPVATLLDPLAPFAAIEHWTLK